MHTSSSMPLLKTKGTNIGKINAYLLHHATVRKKEKKKGTICTPPPPCHCELAVHCTGRRSGRRAPAYTYTFNMYVYIYTYTYIHIYIKSVDI